MLIVGNRNRVLFAENSIHSGYTRLDNELIRHGGHPTELGQDGLMLMAYLVSAAGAPHDKPWETSGQAISKLFGWSKNGDRVAKASERCEKGQRLVRRKHVRNGKEIENRWDYVVCPGGRKFTDEELSRWSRPVER